MVVEDRRAAGERELGEAGARGGVLGLGVDARPHGIQLLQPGEEVGLLRPGAREGLVEVVVRVDEAGRDDRAVQVDALGRLGLGPDPTAAIDEPSTSIQPLSCSDAGVVHRDDPAVCVEGAHDEPGCDSRSPASV